MDLELATIDDIILELRRRKLRFVFVGVGPSNLREAKITYALQCASPEEVIWMVRQLQRHGCDGSATDHHEDET